MTCIIGLVYEGDVYIGGDRSAVDGWNRFVSEETKVFRIGEILIGLSGSHLVNQVVRYELKLSRMQAADESDMQYLVTVFAKEMRELLANVVSKRDDDGEDTFSGGALIGYRGNLYCLSRNYQVNHFTRRYEAVGSGAPFAMGALAAGAPDDPKKMIIKALKIAADLCCDVVGPFDVQVLTTTQENVGDNKSPSIPIDKGESSILTKAERVIIDKLAEAYDLHCQLPVQHPMHRQEFATAIHLAQRIVMCRSVSRQEGWTKDGSI